LDCFSDISPVLLANLNNCKEYDTQIVTNCITNCC